MLAGCLAGFPQYTIVKITEENKINKKSKTTYGMWCEKNGFKYADKEIPDEWFLEP